MANLNELNNHYERQHFQNQDGIVAAIRKYYDDVIQQISQLMAAGVTRSVINNRMDQLLNVMVSKTISAVETGMQQSWEVSNAKNKAFFEEAYRGIELPGHIQAALNNQRTKALQQFIKREEAGLNLSDRIWKTADQFKNLVNEKFDEGISNGNSAYKIARELRSELQNPQTQEKPGQGVYKSPVKNAERVSRTEGNMAYRKSDQESWNNNPLVLGYEIKLSETSKPKTRCELCRMLSGTYPVTFVWSGWHPQCLCFKIPILMSRDMLNQYNKLIAQGKDTPAAIDALQKGARIDKPPAALSNWIENNHERVSGWKQNPYWWNDNKSFVNEILSNLKPE